MDPQDRRAQWEARNVAMREKVDSLLHGLNQQTAALQQAQARAAEVTGRAGSPDGLVTICVNAVGVITDVRFAPSVFTRSTPEKLARSVTETAQEAAATARRQVEAALAPVRGNLPDLPDVIPGAPAIKDLLPGAAAPQAAAPAPNRPGREAPADEDFSTGSVLWGGNR